MIICDPVQTHNQARIIICSFTFVGGFPEGCHAVLNSERPQSTCTSWRTG
jgi:hypothetical protein